jgi:flagellin
VLVVVTVDHLARGLDRRDRAAQISGSDGTSATTAMTALASALTEATSAQASWGAVQNRFDSVVSQLQSSSITLSAARARIVDADFATETAQRARLLLLQDAGVAMLAQANAQPQRVLGLLLG